MNPTKKKQHHHQYSSSSSSSSSSTTASHSTTIQPKPDLNPSSTASSSIKKPNFLKWVPNHKTPSSHSLKPSSDVNRSSFLNKKNTHCQIQHQESIEIKNESNGAEMEKKEEIKEKKMITKSKSQRGEGGDHDEEKKKSVGLLVNGGGRRRSLCDSKIELSDFFSKVGARVMSVDMPPFMQIHAVSCARECYDSLEPKFTAKNLALTLKKFFLWLACLNKCLTVDNLNKRGRFIVSRCPLCKAALETLPYVLMQCDYACKVWSAFWPAFGWAWCMPSSPNDLALGWSAPEYLSSRGKVLWSILPLAIWWGLWLERNARTFQRNESSTLQVTNNIRNFILSWSMILTDCKGLSFRDLAHNWDNCILSL